jgi:rod shape determining protein RodA
LVYLFATVVLIAVLFFGTTIAGTRGWFRIAGFSFQPVELAKVAFILMNARLIDRYGRRFEGMHFVIGSGLIAGVLMGLTFLQPDLGSALVIFGMWFLYLLTARVRFRYVALVAISAITVAILGWFFVLQEYQKDRFATFLDPSADPLGAGYNLNQSMIAIGAGRLTGTGLGYGSQSQLQFLPEAQTDFIFAVIAEELGFVGVLVLFGLFIGLFWRLTTHVSHANSDFAAYTLIGICLLFAIQVVVNVGGTTGLLPITGVTLPFVSYGGSSFLMNCMLIGIAESIRRGSEQTTSSLGI